MGDNNKENLIFKAKVNENNEIVIEVFTSHLPMLNYALKLLELEVENKIIGMSIKQDTKRIKIPEIGGITIGN